MPGGIATPVDTVSKNKPTGSNTNAGGNKEGHFLSFLVLKCLVSICMNKQEGYICFTSFLKLESMKLARTYVSIPWAYDAMKQLYIGKTTNCGMMVGVDIFSQCPDRDRTNNFAVFPVRLLVNETKGNITLIYINKTIS